LIRSCFKRTPLVQWAWFSLVGVGVLWESLLAPSVIGWGFILAGCIAMLLIERRWPSRTPLDWALLLLALTGGVSLCVTAVPRLTKVQVIRLGAGLAGFYGLVSWAQDRVQVLLIAAGLTVGGLGLALLAPLTVDWLRVTTILVPSSLYQHLPLLLSDPVHPNIMASLMVLLFPLPLAWLLSVDDHEPKCTGKRVFLGLASVSMGAILLLTNSRGGYIAGTVGGVMAIWLSRRKWWAFALAFVVIGAGVWLIVIMSEWAPEMARSAVDPASWTFRQQVWRVALLMLADFPFTGVGMGTFNEVASLLYGFLEMNNPGAHNVYLQVGVDLGVPGLIAYLAVLMLTLWMAVTATRAFDRQGKVELRAVTAGALSGMTALMVHGLVDHAVWNTRVAFFPWLVIGLITALFGIVAREGVGSRRTGQFEDSVGVESISGG